MSDETHTQITGALIAAVKADHVPGVFGPRALAVKHKITLNQARAIIKGRSRRYTALEAKGAQHG